MSDEITFDSVRANYLKALKADLEDADRKPEGDEIKFESGRGIIDPVLDPVMRPKDSTAK